MTGPAAATAATVRPAILVLEDGRTFRGAAFGADGETFGEMVFNTGMTGYQETLTDPSYCRQIVAMTAPHIGNTGVNDDDPESRRIWVSGYVIREPAPIASSWRSVRTLEDELRAQDVTGIAIGGTRALTRHLRERGAMRAAIATGQADAAELLERVRASPPMTGADLAREVSTPQAYTVHPPAGTPTRFVVAAVDLGIKAATRRHLARLGCRVHVLPATSAAEQILAVSPDGAFFSNGPGDPAAAGYAVEAMRGVLGAGLPVFGICLPGSGQPPEPDHRQWPRTAAARGRQQPFETAFGMGVISHLNLNDGVVEGLRLLTAPAFSVQYHPEAAPGPHDAAGLFGDFVGLMERSR